MNLNDQLEVLGQSPGLKIYTQISLCFPLVDASSYPAIINSLTRSRKTIRELPMGRRPTRQRRFMQRQHTGRLQDPNKGRCCNATWSPNFKFSLRACDGEMNRADPSHGRRSHQSRRRYIIERPFPGKGVAMRIAPVFALSICIFFISTTFSCFASKYTIITSIPPQKNRVIKIHAKSANNEFILS